MQIKSFHHAKSERTERTQVQVPPPVEGSIVTTSTSPSAYIVDVLKEANGIADTKCFGCAICGFGGPSIFRYTSQHQTHPAIEDHTRTVCVRSSLSGPYQGLALRSNI